MRRICEGDFKGFRSHHVAHIDGDADVVPVQTDDSIEIRTIAELVSAAFSATC
jgi:hypothetical protein